MINKIKAFILNYRKKRLIRKELVKKYKQFKPVGISGKLNPMTSIPRERRIEELTESIYRASKIVKKHVEAETTTINNHSKDTLLDKLKEAIDSHYSEIEKENQELRTELKQTILTKNKYYEQNKKIKETLQKV